MSNWFDNEDFWRTVGPLMFGESQFTEAAEQLPGLLELSGIRPERVLDLGSGPGRYAIPLAAAGMEVTAVDLNEALLGELARRAAAADVVVDTRRADMREFVEPEAFDLVLVMWTSFGYFEDEADHARVLQNIHASLRPGGRLLLDLVGLEYLCRSLQPVHLTEYDDGRILVERPTLTDGLTRLENEWLLIDGDRVRRAQFSHRVWSAGELQHLLTDAGLEAVAVYGGYQGQDYDLDAERLIAVAGKSGRG